jgi:hypothetical protein
MSPAVRDGRALRPRGVVCTTRAARERVLAVAAADARLCLRRPRLEVVDS